MERPENSVKSGSIGSYDAYHELHEPSSLDLMRSSILHSITKKQSAAKTIPGEQERRGIKTKLREDFSDVTQPTIEVKFLEKKCSSNIVEVSSVPEMSDKQQSELSITTLEPVSLDEKSDPQLHSTVCYDLVESNSFEKSQELSNGGEPQHGDHTETIGEAQEMGDVSDNGLKLACRRSSNVIFENCSTYSLNCDDVDLKVQGYKEDSTRGLMESFTEISYQSETDYSIPVSESSENISSLENRSVISYSRQTSDDSRTSLWDTFFPKIVSGDPLTTVDNQLSPPNFDKTAESCLKNKTLNHSIEENCNDRDRDFEVLAQESNQNRKNSKRIRKRNRRSKSKEPYVYKCPKCHVTYVIPSKTMTEVSCCLHCDMWTSVDPVFLKREKQTWNTCRIC